jgi:hypothetical protein
MVRPIYRSGNLSITLSPQASLHFCSECNNLLYPKAEQQRRTMVYACRICPSVDETVDSGLVYRNDLLNITKWVSFINHLSLLGISVREQAGVTTDLGQDPTLVSRPSCPPLISTQNFDSRHIPTLLAQAAVMRSKLSFIFLDHPYTLLSVARSSTKINQRERRRA